MSEKIRALRKALESTGKGGQTQVSSQPAYGKLRWYSDTLLRCDKLTGSHRPVSWKEQEDRTSNHHDFLLTNRFDHHVERQEVPRTGNVSCSFPLLALWRY